MTGYDKGKHTVFYHRYHIVWVTKYRYKILTRAMKERIRTIVAEVSEEMGVKVENGVISSDHLHLFVVILPHVAVSDFVQRAKGRSLRKVQQEFPELKKIYWGRRFWGRGYFSATSGHITDEVINEYINKHTDAHQPHYISSIRLE
ncbi:MAG: IS200/IS605 family transposase [Wolbachia endosymbiont of Alcedoecus sp.]|nr:IS200/IS605 family transposase [Wolbachia endosymbiont of Alcedoecus sp.]